MSGAYEHISFILLLESTTVSILSDSQRATLLTEPSKANKTEDYSNNLFSDIFM